MTLDQNALDSLRIERRESSSRPSLFFTVKRAAALVIIAAAVAAFLLLSERALEVEVTTVTAAPASVGAAVLNASGYVVARREATVSSKVTGKIAEVLIEEGMVVEAGQLLARLDDQTQRPLLTLAERQLEATRQELEETRVREAEAQRNLRRIERLRADQLVSEAQLDQAQSEVAALQARLQALQGSVKVAEATVRLRQQELDDLLVRAPFAGVIVSKDAQPGEMISPVSAGGGFTRTGIATIVDMTSREIEVDVNEAFINRVSTGQKTEAVLDAYPDWTIPSHVVNIVPTADRQKATVKVRIGFDQLDPRILPNMGVKVSFMDDDNGPGARNRPALQAPAAAVIEDNGMHYVWRVQNGRVERVAVRIGGKIGDQMELLSGVNAGDRIIVRPVEGLMDGTAIVERTASEPER
jgi:RND family efflux transporter MFP subunit